MNSRIFSSIFLLVVLLSCSTEKNARLEEALSWIPVNDTYVFFDDWKQIKTDFGFSHEEYISMKWMPQTYNEMGEEIPAEILKDNFAPYASSNFLHYSVIPGTIERIGIRYPDLEWEITSNNFTHIFKFNRDYNRKGLDSLLKALKYTESKYGDYTIFYHQQDPEFYSTCNTTWFGRCSAVCYIEEDHLLLTAPEMDFLKQNLDAHAKNQNFLNIKNISDVLSAYGDAESVYLSLDPPSSDPARLIGGSNVNQAMVNDIRNNLHRWLGLSAQEYKTLHVPVLIALGEEKNGKVTAVLSYEKEEDATEDQEKRLHILQKGKSIQRKTELKDVLFSPKATTSGKQLVLEWTIEPNSTDMINCIFYRDVPWFLYPIENKR